MAIHQDFGPKAPLLTLIQDNAAGPGALRPSALVRWEDEGGSISARPGGAPELVTEASVTTAPSADIPDVADMQTRLNADFANGLVGQRYNTYQHRARIVRQLRSRPTATLSEPSLRSGPSGR